MFAVSRFRVSRRTRDAAASDFLKASFIIRATDLLRRRCKHRCKLAMSNRKIDRRNPAKNSRYDTWAKLISKFLSFLFLFLFSYVDFVLRIRYVPLIERQPTSSSRAAVALAIARSRRYKIQSFDNGQLASYVQDASVPLLRSLAYNTREI